MPRYRRNSEDHSPQGVLRSLVWMGITFVVMGFLYLCYGKFLLSTLDTTLAQSQVRTNASLRQASFLSYGLGLTHTAQCQAWNAELTNAKAPLVDSVRPGVESGCLYSVAPYFGVNPLKDYGLYVRAWSNRIDSRQACADYPVWAADIANDKGMAQQAKDKSLKALFEDAGAKGCWRDKP